VIVNAQSPKSYYAREKQLKTAYLYSFVKFIYWKDLDSHLIRVCVPETSDLLSDFQILNGKRAGTKFLTVISVSPKDNVQQCQVLYVPEKNQESWFKVRRDFKNTVLVGETEELLSAGGHFRFFKSGDMLMFEIHEEHVKQLQDVHVSSKLLELNRKRGEN
jgi:hypothetical protein